MKTTLNQRIRFSALLGIVLVFGITLSACGQKGALYLSDKASNNTPKQSQQASSATSTAN